MISAQARRTRERERERKREKKAGKNEESEREAAAEKFTLQGVMARKEARSRERVRMVMVAAVETVEEEGSECSRVRNSDPSRIFI